MSTWTVGECTKEQAAVNRQKLQAGDKPPAADLYIDEGLQLVSGQTFDGNGCTLHQPFYTSTFGRNCVLNIQGQDPLGYGNQSNFQGAIATPQNPANFKPGDVCWSSAWSAYAEGLHTCRRHVVLSNDGVRVRLDSEPHPKANILNWSLGGRPAYKMERGGTMAYTTAATQFPVGSYVYVTDAQSIADGRHGEIRRVITRSKTQLMFDRPLCCTFDPNLSAVVPIVPLTDVTIKNTNLVVTDPSIYTSLFATYTDNLILDQVAVNSSIWLINCTRGLLMGASASSISFNASADCRLVSCSTRNWVCEEGCAAIGAVDLTIHDSYQQLNGLNWGIGSEDLSVRQSRVIDSGGCPILVTGERCVLEHVAVSGSKMPQTPCYLKGDQLRVDSLSADCGLEFQSGLAMQLLGCRSPGIGLTESAGGIAVDCQSVYAKGSKWVVQ